MKEKMARAVVSVLSRPGAAERLCKLCLFIALGLMAYAAVLADEGSVTALDTAKEAFKAAVGTASVGLGVYGGLNLLR